MELTRSSRWVVSVLWAGVLLAAPSVGFSSVDGCYRMEDGTSYYLMENGVDRYVMEGGGACGAAPSITHTGMQGGGFW